MKKLFLALVILIVLSLPAFASFRLGGSVDFGDTGGDIGITAHALFTFLEPVKNALEIGAGASFWIPLNEISELAIYASGLIYPLNFSGGKTGWYGKLNLGFNIPVIGAEGTGGGFYWGIGTGYDITSSIFVEVLYASYKVSVDAGWIGWATSFGVIHLGIGVKL